MPGTRLLSIPARGRSTLALSVLALLASACLLSAPAQADSGEIEYRDAPPTVTGKAPNDHEPSAGSSNAAGGGGSAGGGNAGGGAAGGSGQGGSSAGSDGGGQANGGSGQGSQGKDYSSSIGSGKVAGEAAPASSGGDGGTSPLVPVLIAIAALAAISLGAVVYRRRRGGPARSGSSVSPEVG